MIALVAITNQEALVHNVNHLAKHANPQEPIVCLALALTER